MIRSSRIAARRALTAAALVPPNPALRARPLSSSSSPHAPTPRPTRSRNVPLAARLERAVEENASDTAPFGEMRVWAPVAAALAEMGVSRPTEVQSLVIPEARRGDDLMFAAQTGTGKTLAFLVPVVEALKRAEAGGTRGRAGRPRALVLVPTRELAQQVRDVCARLAHHAKFSTALVTSGMQDRHIRRQFDGRAVDVVVATPGRLARMVRAGVLRLSDVAHVVVDEADTMYGADAGFADAIDEVVGPVRARAAAVRKAARQKEKEKEDLEGETKAPAAAQVGRAPSDAQFILTSATLRADHLRRHFPGMRAVHSRSANRTLAQLDERFERLRGRDKLEALAGVLRRPEQRAEASTIVFCRTVGSCRAVEHRLREEGFASACYHGDMPSQARAAAWSAFRAGEAPLLVCTDLASRGLDTTFVGSVINFDMPLNPTDYLHRVGRTARAGRGGRVVSLVGRGDELLAAALAAAKSEGDTVHQLSSARADYTPAELQGYADAWQEREGRRRGGGKGRRAKGVWKAAAGQAANKPGKLAAGKDKKSKKYWRFAKQ